MRNALLCSGFESDKIFLLRLNERETFTSNMTGDSIFRSLVLLFGQCPYKRRYLAALYCVYVSAYANSYASENQAGKRIFIIILARKQIIFVITVRV